MKDKVKIVGDSILFFCPACKEIHSVSASGWSFNNNAANPTFNSQQSIIIGPRHSPDCHFFIHNGLIYFWRDLYGGKHPYRDHTLELPTVDLWFKEFKPVFIRTSGSADYYRDNIRYANRKW
jgi:hypothetical protein